MIPIKKTSMALLPKILKLHYKQTGLCAVKLDRFIFFNTPFFVIDLQLSEKEEKILAGRELSYLKVLR